MKQKFFIVTEENVELVRAFQGTAQSRVKPGLKLYLSKQFPASDIVFLTDKQPSANSRRMLNRVNEPEADTYGWKETARITQMMLDEGEETAFNRYTINKADLKHVTLLQ